MDRRKFRLVLFKLMFQVEFQEEFSVEEAIELYGAGDEAGEAVCIKEKDKKQLKEKIDDMLSKKAELDSIIEQYSSGWKLNRIGKAELAILRLAIYEILYDSIPAPVAINEAVELAKQYTDERAPAFINGILGNVARHIKTDRKKG